MDTDNEESRCGLSNRGWSNVGTIMPKIKDAVAERVKAVNNNIDLSTSDNWLIRPEMMEVCRKAFDSGLHEKHFSYANGITGDPDCVNAFAGFFNAYFNPHIPVEPSHCITAPGAAGCIDALLYNICDPGDGILLPAPYWSGIEFTIKNRSSVVPIAVNAPDISLAVTDALLPALENAIESATCPVKAMLISNPHNPLGQCYPKSVLEGFVRFCNKHKIHLISDEIYAMTAFKTDDLINPVPFTSILSIDIANLGCDLSLIHTIWSTSKDFGVNGVRMGCTVTQGNKALAVGHALAALYLTSSLTAVFVVALLTSPELPALLELNSQRLARSYEILTAFFKSNSIAYIPCNSGLYVLARLAPMAKTWEDEATVIQKMKDTGVLVAAGHGYHCPENEKGWARVSFTVKVAELEEAIRRLQKAFDDLKQHPLTQ